MTFPDGSVYKGGFIKNIIQGYGEYYYKSVYWSMEK